jgi:hypothetical protein
MNTKPTLPSLQPATHFVAAALAAVIAIGMLASITTLFQRDGLPMERAVVAERACADLEYRSERDACIRAQLATPVVAVAVR